VKTVHRYILREMMPAFLLGAGILTLILMTNKAFLLLELVLSKKVPILDTLGLYLDLLPFVLSMTIPMAMMVAVLLAFGRLGSDMEVTAFKSGGLHPFRLIAPVLAFGAALTTFLLYFNDRVLPAANFAFRTHHFEIVRKQANVAIRERTFVDKFEGYKFLIDRRERDGSFSDVKAFNRFSAGGPLQTTLAKTGSLDSDPKTFRVFFRLGKGVMTWDNKTYNTYNRLYFEKYAINLKLGNRLSEMAGVRKNFEDMTLSELSGGLGQETDPKRRRSFENEYQKRFSLAFSCLVFAWFCSPLGLWVRSKGFMSFVLGVSMIFVYYLMFTLGQALSERGLVGPIPGLWGANAVLFLAGSLLYYLVVAENSAFKTPVRPTPALPRPVGPSP